jgi:hypothetical protein
MVQRLETIGNRGISFFDLLEHKSQYAKKNYIQKNIKYYRETSPSMSQLKVWFHIFKLYFGAVSIFKPTIAMGVYCKYKPKHILDPTMGWGGRLLGACVLDVPYYTGFDLNKSLEQPYKKMIEELKPTTTTKIDVRFIDALKVDYSKIDYDMVLTSPPYYNIELYKGTKQQSKDDWDEKFYRPLFEKTWKHLKKGGHYCLNVPDEVYERVLKPMLGKANEFIVMPKQKRRPDEKYKEFIYVWVK